MKFIRKIKRAQNQKAYKDMVKEQREKGLKPKYIYNPAARKKEMEWVPVKMQVVGHNPRRKVLLERRKIIKTI